MQVKSARFIASNTSWTSLPKDPVPEYAFIGRSNVGKSSLINMICNRTKLAKTSATPGKTQLINHFFIDEKWFMVDLPGYGYARLSKTHREKLGTMINDYLLKRKQLLCVFVLVDSRLDPQKADLDFVNWLGTHGIPFVIVFTKCDKQSKLQVQRKVNGFMQTLEENWEELPRYFLSSSVEKSGRDEILEFIEVTNSNFKIN